MSSIYGGDTKISKGGMFIIGMAFFTMVRVLLVLQDLNAYDGVDLALKESQREPRLADGCHHIFLDVGANIGVHTRFLFEPQLYPLAAEALGVFNEMFGTERDNRDICSFAFEPNPAHVKRHTDLEQAYTRMGWRYKFLHAGVSDSNGNLTFWHNADAESEEWGFSAAKTTPNAVAEVVPLLRLSEWLQHHIAERKLPEKVFGNYTDSTGKVLMKMDIEGSEYMVLPSLLFTGAFCNSIDLAFGETHQQFATMVKRPAIDAKTGRGEVTFSTPNEAHDWYYYLMEKAFKGLTPEDCKARWIYLDDESYLHDGQPFPKPAYPVSNTSTATPSGKP